MKKSLLALAALSAIAGAASAQSSVTISGVIDVGLEKSTGTALQMAASKMATSNLTFKGVEDLGGGLKAGFTLSHEFQADNGDSVAPSGGTGWGNFGSWVGLSGGFGSVDVGNVFTTTFKNHQTPNGTKGGTNSNAYKVLAFDACDPGAAGAAAGTIDAAKTNSCAHVFSRNTVQYNSPSIGGLSASLDVVFPETLTTPTGAAPAAGTIGEAAQHGHTFGLKYVVGPVDVRTAVDRGVGKNKDLVLLSASVDLGAVKLFANFENGQVRLTDAQKSSAYLLGARAPVGSAGSFWIHLGKQTEGSTFNAANLTATSGTSVYIAPGATAASDVSILGFGYQHKLSARTSLYGNYGTLKNGNSDADRTDVGFGVAHTF
ncbi:MAG: porin [Leptothrix ochracea]|uniref:porin n=1 Tax=Leptothrix ochracea TaxID=735331 RepID=UPI0034E1EF9F